MSNQKEKKTKHHSARSTLILVIVLLIALSFLIVVSGQKAWEKQTVLTQSFERCMEKAPFKSRPEFYNSEKNLLPEDLQKYFDQFNQIFDATGLPPIWNGKRLLPWKEFHQKSIQIAKECHQELGITRPQQELRGSYSKPVWDPMSAIWQSDQAPS